MSGKLRSSDVLTGSGYSGLSTMGYTGLICCHLFALNLPLTTQNQVVCPQTGAVEMTQLDEFGDSVLVNRPGGLVELQCKFTIPPDPTDTDTGLFFTEWVLDGTTRLYRHSYVDNQTNIFPGFDDLVVTVTDNFTNIVPSSGQYIQGSSTITLDVTLAITNEFKCNVILKDHTYCDDTTTIQFKDPDITLLSDGEPYYSNYGDPPWREEIPSGNHNVTCEVKHSQNNVPELTMAIMVDDVEITSQSSVGASVNNERFYDGSITASYDVPENVQSTCTVTDARGTYSITSPPADPCNPNPCRYNGTCTISGDTFDCACLQPWAGETCEANPCFTNPCENEGTCTTNQDATFSCTCKPTWTGTTCDSRICTDDWCENGGTCQTNGSDNPTCTCPEGYSGDRCETGVCSSNPCQNNGRCEHSDTGYVCDSPENYNGIHCENNVAVVTTSSLEDGWIALIVIIVLGLLIFLVLVLLFLKKKKERSDYRPESVKFPNYRKRSTAPLHDISVDDCDDATDGPPSVSGGTPMNDVMHDPHVDTSVVMMPVANDNNSTHFYHHSNAADVSSKQEDSVKNARQQDAKVISNKRPSMQGLPPPERTPSMPGVELVPLAPEMPRDVKPTGVILPMPVSQPLLQPLHPSTGDLPLTPPALKKSALPPLEHSAEVKKKKKKRKSSRSRQPKQPLEGQPNDSFEDDYGGNTK